MGSYDSADIAHLVLFISEIRLLKFSRIANRILIWLDEQTFLERSTDIRTIIQSRIRRTSRKNPTRRR